MTRDGHSQNFPNAILRRLHPEGLPRITILCWPSPERHLSVMLRLTQTLRALISFEGSMWSLHRVKLFIHGEMEFSVSPEP
jgi:hypothetical protein